VGFDELGGWPIVLGALMRGEDLSSDLAAAALREILDGNASSAQIAAFATLLHAKGETIEELSSLVRTLLEFAEPVPTDADVVDTCGSGGSAQRRIAAFNVSTISALVLAGAGAKVAKHGGRAASATSSSADLLTALGVNVELGPEGVARCIEEAGMGFCFAPTFHPAMRHAAPTRRELGVPTIFNFIAPLSNPARPRRQLLGVSDPSIAEKMLRVLHANGATRAMVVHGHDGLDELTTTTTSSVFSLENGEVRHFDVDPSAFGVPVVAPGQVRGGDAATNADLTRRVLAGDVGAHRDIVLLNASAAIVVAGLASSLEDGLVAAADSIDSGRAAAALDTLIATSQDAAGG
jgi:anthranilate phosphoribosyltransferase